MNAEKFFIAVAFVAGVYLGFMAGAVSIKPRIHAALVQQGVGRYVVDPVTGETSIQWAKIAEAAK